MGKWKLICNCDSRAASSWKKAARQLGMKLTIGPCDSRGTWDMKGVYVDASLTHEEESRLTNRYFVCKSEDENNPFRYDYVDVPAWIFVIMGIVIVLLLVARFG